MANLADGLTNTMDLLNDETDYGAKFLNPANDDVQNFVLQLLGDLAKYDLDGIILDRCRYDDYGLESDFSAVSKQKFEEYIGETVAHFRKTLWHQAQMRYLQISLPISRNGWNFV